MAAAGLSDGFVYAPKPPAAPASNIRVTVPPYNKDSFKNGNDSVMFYLPGGKRGQYLNTRQSYLKFEVDVKFSTPGTSAGKVAPVLKLDGGAHSFFNSLEVYHGSNLLEQIREYNSLYQVLQDTGENPVDGSGCRSVAEGESGTLTPSGFVRDADMITPYVHPRGVKPEVSIVGNPHDVAQGTNYQSIDLPNKVASSLTLPVGEATGVSEIKGISAENGVLFTLNDTSTTPTMAITRGIVNASNPYRADSATVYSGRDVVTYTFCIPIYSGIVGTAMGKYLPMGSLAADLQLHLGLAPFEQALKSIAVMDFNTSSAHVVSYAPRDIVTKLRNSLLSQTHDITLRNFELELEYIEVASDVQMAIEAATGGQYVMSFDSFNHFQGTLGANPGAATQLIGAKFSSIKTALTTFKDIYKTNNIAFGGVTSRVNPFSVLPNRPEFMNKRLYKWPHDKYVNGTGWQYLIGSTHYPPRPVSSNQEAFMEFQKSQHMIASQQRSGKFDASNWGVSAMRDNASSGLNGTPNTWQEFTSEGGSFVMAQNFESQSHKSHLAESGINTLAQTMYMVSRFPPSKKYNTYTSDKTGALMSTKGTPTHYTDFVGTSIAIASTDNTYSEWEQGNQALLVDHFIHYDGILIISNGIASTRF